MRNTQQRRNFVVLVAILILIPMSIIGAVLIVDDMRVEQSQHTWTVLTAQEAIREDPKDGHANAALGAAFMDRKDYARAIQQFQKASALDNADCGLHYYLATALMASGDRRSAEKEWRMAIQLDNSEPRSWVTEKSKRMLEQQSWQVKL